MGWRDPFVEEVAGKELIIVATICTVLDDRIKRVGLTSELSLQNILLILLRLIVLQAARVAKRVLSHYWHRVL